MEKNPADKSKPGTEVNQAQSKQVNELLHS